MLAENFIFVKEHFHLNHIYQILLRTKKRRVWFFYDSLFLLRAASIHFAENLSSILAFAIFPKFSCHLLQGLNAASIPGYES